MPLPPGVYLRYGGAAEAQAAAARELLLHSAAAFVLIVLLLALAFGHARHVLLVLLALPSTLIGGVAAVALTGGTLTLGAMVGFVALFGMAARNTILLISHYDHLVGDEGAALESGDLDARRGGAPDAGAADGAADRRSRCCRSRCSCISRATRSKARWRSSSWAAWYPLHW